MSFTIQNDGATPALQQLRDALGGAQRKELARELGQELATQYQAWFRARNAASPNQYGWPRQNFWNRLAAATRFDEAKATETGVAVTIADPAINAKVYGGTWGAKTAGALAIPLRGDVYGTQPKTNAIPGLHFVPNPKPGKVVGWLATGAGAQTIYYWRLQKSVTLAPDPQALPENRDVLAALLARAQAWLRKQAGGNGGGAGSAPATA